jgi:hypothetical protein
MCANTHVASCVATGDSSYEALWAAHARLRAENKALWEAWAGAESLPEAKQHACAATGSAMGLSLGPIITLLTLCLPHGAVPSRATVGRWVSQASRQAAALLAVCDQLCQQWVLGCVWMQSFCIASPS